MPVITNQESSTNVVLALIEAIPNPSLTSPFEFIGANKLQAIRKLTHIFKKKNNPQETPHKEIVQNRLEVI